MPEQTSPKATNETTEIKFASFLIGREIVEKPIDCSERFIVKLKVKVDKETLSTVPDESEKEDLVAIIQTYRDQCGMEYAQRLLRTGQAVPSDFADDGKHSGTVTAYLDTAQGRANAALQARNQTEALASALGIPADGSLTDEQLSALVAKAIQEKYPGMIKTPEGGNNDAE